MKISDLTPAQVRHYFETRIGCQFRGESVKQVARCPFHGDKKPSLSLDFSKAAWFCFAGCGEGGLISFEEKFRGAPSRHDALKAIFESVGEDYEPQFDDREEPEAIYAYTDEHERLLFEKLRYPGKKFRQRKLGEKGQWEYQLGNVRKPLYNLPSVVTANQVIVVEGEKDADNVARLNLSALDARGWAKVAVTTNFDGAGKWDPKHSRYFTGKDVAIFPDFDEPGMRHAKLIAPAISDFAASVKVVQLPGLAEHGDVSDYLLTHSAIELVEEIKKAELWRATKSPLFLSAPEFMRSSSAEIDWMVEGIIERGASGFIVSDPKCGKSWCAVDLALALATGTAWLGLNVPKKSRVALITREDNPALTKWRMKRLAAGRELREEGLEGQLFVNSREQSPVFKLDVAEQLSEMMVALKQFEPEFIILDVLNVLHSSDENDAKEMRVILDSAQLVSDETHAGVCVLHHFNKDVKNGRLTQRIRGSSAMAGWAEYVIGLHRENDNTDDPMRWAEFELKAGSPLPKLYFSIQSDDISKRTVLTVEQAPEKPRRRKRGDDSSVSVP